jgi:hypothetical protein
MRTFKEPSNWLKLGRNMDEDDWFTSKIRTVRFEPLFEEQIRKLGIAPERLEEALAGLDFALARHPEIFPKVPGTGFSIAKLNVYGDTPELRVFFKYNAVEVMVICVEFAE